MKCGDEKNESVTTKNLCIGNELQRSGPNIDPLITTFYFLSLGKLLTQLLRSPRPKILNLRTNPKNINWKFLDKAINPLRTQPD